MGMIPMRDRDLDMEIDRFLADEERIDRMRSDDFDYASYLEELRFEEDHLEKRDH